MEYALFYNRTRWALFYGSPPEGLLLCTKWGVDMDDHEQIQDHENRIRKLEDSTDDMRQRLDNLSDEVKKGNASNNQANEFLMKQNMHITDILGGIQQKKQEGHIVSWQSTGKIAMAVSAVVGLVTVVINLIFH